MGGTKQKKKKKKSFQYLIIDIIKHSSVAGGNARGRKRDGKLKSSW